MAGVGGPMAEEAPQQPGDAPTLIAYRIHKYPSMPILPATNQRDWMDKTGDRLAYRCLPLLIANQTGWFIINVHHMRVIWNGSNSTDGVRILCKSGPEGTPCPAV